MGEIVTSFITSPPDIVVVKALEAWTGGERCRIDPCMGFRKPRP